MGMDSLLFSPPLLLRVVVVCVRPDMASEQPLPPRQAPHAAQRRGYTLVSYIAIPITFAGRTISVRMNLDDLRTLVVNQLESQASDADALLSS